MKKLLLAIISIVCLYLSASADIAVSSGEKSKSFSSMTDRMTQIINRKDITNLNSKGSLENIDNLISNKAQVGLAFADSFMYKKASDPRTDKLKIIGHTDDIGNESYNQTLSEKRAQNVANVFIQAGYKQQNIQTFGRGPSQPLLQNNSNENRAINRRVNVVIIP